MYSFGQLKNSVRRLEEVNRNMNILSNIRQPKSVLSEKQIKTQPVEFYLKIIHYIFTEYSPDFYEQILDIVPNIKTLNDQKFVECALNIGRKLFGMNPKINVQQFLQNGKWVQKKLEFVVQLCQNIVAWQKNIQKKYVKQPKKSQYGVGKVSPKKYLPEEDDEDEDMQVQRVLQIQPTVLPDEYVRMALGEGAAKNAPKKMQVKKEAHKFDFQEKETISMAKGRPNVFPKAMKSSYAEDQQQQQDSNEFISTAMRPKQQVAPHSTQIHPQKQPNMHLHSPQQPEQSGNEPVTRQQLNEVLHMMSTLNTTMNNLVSKFNNLQTYVSNQMNKSNARMSLLEENVKIIKNNL